jgi:DNA modification methylase
MENLKVDLFGEPIIENVLLRKKFLEPPFSVLDTKGGDWQNRKREWKTLGIKSELGRDDHKGNQILKNGFNFEKYGRTGNTSSDGSGTSIFDPALCELMYHWYCPNNGSILDPFAGGSVRGIIANYLGYNYTGIDIREEQIESNYQQGREILPDHCPKWICNDSNIELDLFDTSFDMIFSCPPYADLEIYSDLIGDISNKSYKDFLILYESIIYKSCKLLKSGGYAVFVVGDVRDKKTGYYKDFISDTKKAFIKAGAGLYNEAILLQPLGTAMLRAGKIFISGGKLTKVHENILIFKKP